MLKNYEKLGMGDDFGMNLLPVGDAHSFAFVIDCYCMLFLHKLDGLRVSFYIHGYITYLFSHCSSTNDLCRPPGGTKQRSSPRCANLDLWKVLDTQLRTCESPEHFAKLDATSLGFIFVCFPG